MEFQNACEHGYTEIVRLQLQDCRVDPRANDNYAIRLASQYGNTEVVRLLLQDPRVDPSADNNYAIKIASLNGHTEVVRLLLQDPRVDPGTANNYAIRQASEDGHTEVVRLLLQNPRVDPGVNDNYSIQKASAKGHTEVVRLLLQDPRVDPSAENSYAIQIASRNSHTEVVRLLLQDPRVDPGAFDNYSIQFASRNGHTEVVRLLLQDPRVDPSVNDNNAIRQASLNGQTEAVRLLLQDPRVTVKDSTIQLAKENGYPEIVRLLQTRVANVNIPHDVKCYNIISLEEEKVIDYLIEDEKDNIVITNDKVDQFTCFKKSYLEDLFNSDQKYNNVFYECNGNNILTNNPLVSVSLGFGTYYIYLDHLKKAILDMNLKDRKFLTIKGTDSTTMPLMGMGAHLARNGDPRFSYVGAFHCQEGTQQKKSVLYT